MRDRSVAFNRHNVFLEIPFAEFFMLLHWWGNLQFHIHIGRFDKLLTISRIHPYVWVD